MRPFARFRAVLPRAASLFIYRLLPNRKKLSRRQKFCMAAAKAKNHPPPFSGGGA
jgi:hypothetical protein